MGSHNNTPGSQSPSEPKISPTVFTPVKKNHDVFDTPPTSAGSTSSSTFWQSSPIIETQSSSMEASNDKKRLFGSLYLLLGFLTGLSVVISLRMLLSPIPAEFGGLVPAGHPAISPESWLAKYSHDSHAMDRTKRPRAVIISLVRNEELDGIVQSMEQLELRWNHKYQYPWIFFSDEQFSERFKSVTSNLTTAPCFYEIVPVEHWSIPDWVESSRFMDSLDYLGTIGVGKGWMLSYRHMCRWNSGFFYKHPRLQDYDFYWRVEPDVHFFCDINYDVFRFMRDNNMKYGFTMNILDDARSFPSLWSETRAFINARPELIHSRADLDWLMDAQGEYNNCQFFSNFEIGDLRFFRSESNEAYFDWLDKSVGFYYERFGDAPIHTLSVAMFLPKEEVWYFKDIGYQHDLTRHCPQDAPDRCNCEPTSMDENFYKLVPIESPQMKPDDTCIRRFLGGKYLKKKEGWRREAERAIGGDGYHGYEIGE